MGRKADELRNKINALSWAVKAASDDYADTDDEKSAILYFVWETCKRILMDDETASELWDAIEPDWFKA